jgi:hypothetical protein
MYRYLGEWSRRDKISTVYPKVFRQVHISGHAALLTSCTEKPCRDETFIRIPPDVTSLKLAFPETCRSLTHKSTTFEIQYNP